MITKKNEDSYKVYGEITGLSIIDIFRNTNMKPSDKGKWEISWSSIGGVDVEIVEEFVEGLNEAIKFVKENGG